MLPLVAGLLCGCAAPLRRPIAPAEQDDFRWHAVQYLRECAASDDPVLRMQAIESMENVAPDENAEPIAANIYSPDPGVAFASVMALGTLQRSEYVEDFRTRAEDPDPNVVIGALYALHRCGDQRRTTELAQFLLDHPSAWVRGNAALALGRLGEPSAVKPLTQALRRERKTAVQFQIQEALAMLGDRQGVERLIFQGYSAVPEQATVALMMLANARCEDALELFVNRLDWADHAEVKLQAARGLGRLGYDYGLDLALAHLLFRSPRTDQRHDPPEQQIYRVRQLAALALGAIGKPEALGLLRDVFFDQTQDQRVRLAAARAAIDIIDRPRRRAEYLSGRLTPTAQPTARPPSNGFAPSGPGRVAGGSADGEADPRR